MGVQSCHLRAPSQPSPELHPSRVAALVYLQQAEPSLGPVTGFLVMLKRIRANNRKTVAASALLKLGCLPSSWKGAKPRGWRYHAKMLVPCHCSQAQFTGAGGSQQTLCG